MLKFVCVALLFVGLAVQGQENFDESDFSGAKEQVAEENQETEVAKDAVNYNEKVNVKFNQESEESEESHEEDSEEEESADYSAATSEVVSQTMKDEFDQEDDFGSQVLEDKKEGEEEEQNDESGARCWKPRCGYFIHARNAFYKWKNYCYRCLRAKYSMCKRKCRIYAHVKRRRYTQCRYYIKLKLKPIVIALNKNLKYLKQANYYVKRYLYLIRYYHKRAKRLSWRTVYHRRRHYWHWYIRYRNAANAWLRHVRAVANRLRLYYRKRRYYWNRKNCRAVAGYSNAIYHWRRRYNYALKRYYAYVRARNHLYRLFKIYNYYYALWLRIHYFIKRYRAWLNRRNWLLRRRRALWHAYRVYGNRYRKACFHYVRVLYWRCVLCKGPCGRACWNMHHLYALTIVRAHMCRLQYVLCRRKVYYLRRYYAYNRSCHYCWRRTHPHLRLLVCSGRCGARYKYLLMYRYYHRKCHR